MTKKTKFRKNRKKKTMKGGVSLIDENVVKKVEAANEAVKLMDDTAKAAGKAREEVAAKEQKHLRLMQEKTNAEKKLHQAARELERLNWSKGLGELETIEAEAEAAAEAAEAAEAAATEVSEAQKAMEKAVAEATAAKRAAQEAVMKEGQATLEVMKKQPKQPKQQKQQKQQKATGFGSWRRRRVASHASPSKAWMPLSQVDEDKVRLTRTRQYVGGFNKKTKIIRRKTKRKKQNKRKTKRKKRKN